MSILIMMALSLCAYAQGFNEDSLYMAIKEMPDTPDKLSAIDYYIYNSQRVPRVREQAIRANILAAKLGNSTERARSLSVLGWATAMCDANMDKALSYFFESLNICDTIHNQQLRCKVLLQICSAFFSKNILSDGLEYLHMAKDEIESLGDSELRCQAQSLEGWSYNKLKMHNFALASYSNLYNYACSKADSLKITEAMVGLAGTYLSRYESGRIMSDLDSAVYFMDSVINSTDISSGNSLQLYQIFPHICVEMAKVSDKAGRREWLARGLDLSDKGRTLAKSLHMLNYMDNILVARAEVLLELGMGREAYEILCSVDRMSALDVLLIYYQKNKDYKKQLAIMEEIHLKEAQQAGAQIIISGNRKNAAQAIYEHESRRLEQEKKEREFRFELETERHNILRFILKVISILVGIVVLVFAVFLISQTRTNRVLSEQNNLILSQNTELESLQEEIQRQTDELKTQSLTLVRQTRNLESTHMKLMEGISWAKKIQVALVPTMEQMVDIFGECLVYWRPLMVVSGDFYWVAKVKDMRMLAVCDCTGHGVPGALLSMLGVSFLNDISAYRGFREPDPAAIIGTLRSMILREIGEECDDGMDMSFIIIDDASQQVHYAGALRPMYLLRDGDITVYKPNRMPVGRYVIKDKPFTEQVFDYRKNDRIFMFSDGMTDVFPADGGKKLNDRLFRQFLLDNGRESFASLSTALDNLYAECGPEAVIDDQLLVGIEL